MLWSGLVFFGISALVIRLGVVTCGFKVAARQQLETR
jgi:hypothetical protein